MTPTSRPYLLVTREGWYYAFVVLFIIGGAVLREVNLLVILAGMMIAPLLFNWRIVARSMSRLSIQRDLPQRCEAGQPIRVRIRLQNHGPFQSWMLTATDSIRTAKLRRRQFVEVWIPHLPGQSKRSVAYRMVLTERGKYRFGPLRVICRFPFGLIRATVFWNAKSRLIVWPRIGRLTDTWKGLLRGDRMGAQHSRSRRGSDGEFYALRPFAAGDSMRMIHWRSTAKVGEPMVRETERLELPEVSLVIDPYVPDSAADDDNQRLEQMLRMAATVILDVCKEAAGSVTVTFAGNEPLCWRASPSRRFAEQVLDELAVLNGQQASTAAAVETANTRCPFGAAHRAQHTAARPGLRPLGRPPLPVARHPVIHGRPLSRQRPRRPSTPTASFRRQPRESGFQLPADAAVGAPRLRPLSLGGRHMRPIERCLQFSIAIMAILGTWMMSLGGDVPLMLPLMLIVTACSLVFSDILGWFFLHRYIVNGVALLAMVFTLSDFLEHDSTGQLLSIAYLLISWESRHALPAEDGESLLVHRCVEPVASRGGVGAEPRRPVRHAPVRLHVHLLFRLGVLLPRS